MSELFLGKYYDEYKNILKLWHKEMDKIYGDDEIIDDYECKEKMFNFFKKHASKELYAFMKNTKPIENLSSIIIN